jgi:hypothetical protein
MAGSEPAVIVRKSRRACADAGALFVTGEVATASNGTVEPSTADTKATKESKKFKKGRSYQFRRSASGQVHSNTTTWGNPLRYTFMFPVEGNGVTMMVFRSTEGGWLETFTPLQLADYVVKEAKK